MKTSFLATLILLAFSIPSFSLDSMEKGQEIQKLDFLVGAWDVHYEALMEGEKKVAEGEAKFTWLPGEVWLQEEISVTIPGVGLLSINSKTAYDSKKNEYVRHWTNNVTPRNFTYTGNWTDQKTLELKGSNDLEGDKVFWFFTRENKIFLKSTITKLANDEVYLAYYFSKDGSKYTQKGFMKLTKTRSRAGQP